MRSKPGYRQKQVQNKQLGWIYKLKVIEDLGIKKLRSWKVAGINSIKTLVF